MPRPPLSEEEICKWADLWLERHGRWPRVKDGLSPSPHGDSWSAIDNALSHGLRGLTGGSSLTKLLAKKRGKRNASDIRLTFRQILEWAIRYVEEQGSCPLSTAGKIHWAKGETWSGVDQAITKGLRGLPKGRYKTLADFLDEHNLKHSIGNRPPLTEKMIIQYAEKHYERSGVWPTRNSGPVPGTKGDTWRKIDTAMRNGHRSLTKGNSLARLLMREKGVRNCSDLPRLTLKMIREHAKKHWEITGQLPTVKSGPVHGTNGETWQAIESDLREGARGLRGGDTLAGVLKRLRNKCPDKSNKRGPLIRKVDPVTRTYFRGDASVRLTGIEFGIVCMLTARPDGVPARVLMDTLKIKRRNTLLAHISNLNHKLDEVGEKRLWNDGEGRRLIYGLVNRPVIEVADTGQAA